MIFKPVSRYYTCICDFVLRLEMAVLYLVLNCLLSPLRKSFFSLCPGQEAKTSVCPDEVLRWYYQRALLQETCGKLLVYMCVSEE